jgi:hypothetical protein
MCDPRDPILCAPPEVAGFEVFLGGRFWVFGDTSAAWRAFRCQNKVARSIATEVPATMLPENERHGRCKPWLCVASSPDLFQQTHR